METEKHSVYALTTCELKDLRSTLERTIREIAPDGPVAEYLRNDLVKVIAEQDARTHISQVSRRNDGQDHHCVQRLTTSELERLKRDLQANLGLIADDSPARPPIMGHLRAVDTELAGRTDSHRVSGKLL